MAISSITLLSIVLLHFAHVQSVRSNADNYLPEGFDVSNKSVSASGWGVDDPNLLERGNIKNVNRYVEPTKQIIQNAKLLSDDGTFVKAEPKNPFGNVLLTDYDYNPNKKPAPPSFTTYFGTDILKQAKQMVVNANPGQPDIANKLFNDLGNEFVFEQSMQPFYSTASTTIPNDQSGFADFCYGSSVSAKEGNNFALNNNNPRYNLY